MLVTGRNIAHRLEGVYVVGWRGVLLRHLLVWVTASFQVASGIDVALGGSCSSASQFGVF